MTKLPRLSALPGSTKRSWGWRLRPCVTLLRRFEVRFAVVGGAAVAARGARERAPRDLDVVVLNSQANHHRLAEAVAAMIGLWFGTARYQIDWEALNSGDAVRLVSPALRLHIIGPQLPEPGVAVTGALRNQIVNDADYLLVDRTVTPVASARSLIAMKSRSDRAQDLEDVARLSAAGLSRRGVLGTPGAERVGAGRSM